MAFYENTIVAKQDLVIRFKPLKNKHNEVINNSSEKFLKIENCL